MGCSASDSTSSASPSAVAKKANGPQKEKVTLGYFQLRGAARGNPARYMLNYAGVEYEHKIYINTEAEWRNNKDNLGLDFPNLPYLIVDDFKMTETLAVHQYICEKFCPAVLGVGPAERARRFTLQAQADEKFIAAAYTCFRQDDRAVTTKTFMDNLKPMVDNMGAKKFLGGADPCIADFILFEHIQFAQKLSDNKVFATYPTLQAFESRMANLSGLKEYLASDRHITQPWVPGFAKVQIDVTVCAGPLKKDIEAFCDKEFAIWLAGSSQAQKDAGDAEMEKFMTDEAFGASEMKKMYADFDTADVNKDGKLDLAEFTTFIAKMKADELAKGSWWNPIDTTSEMYDLHNRHSKGDGVTLAEFESTMNVWMEKWGPMREASRAQ